MIMASIGLLLTIFTLVIGYVKGLQARRRPLDQEALPASRHGSPWEHWMELQDTSTLQVSFVKSRGDRQSVDDNVAVQTGLLPIEPTRHGARRERSQSL